jgi:acyl-CoA thioester hydrolase
MSTDVIQTTFRMRYAETDQMGIVHHSAYVMWLEQERSQMLRQGQYWSAALRSTSALIVGAT